MNMKLIFVASSITTYVICFNPITFLSYGLKEDGNAFVYFIRKNDKQSVTCEYIGSKDAQSAQEATIKCLQMGKDVSSIYRGFAQDIKTDHNFRLEENLSTLQEVKEENKAKEVGARGFYVTDQEGDYQTSEDGSYKVRNIDVFMVPGNLEKRLYVPLDDAKNKKLAYDCIQKCSKCDDVKREKLPMLDKNGKQKVSEELVETKIINGELYGRYGNVPLYYDGPTELEACLSNYTAQINDKQSPIHTVQEIQKPEAQKENVAIQNEPQPQEDAPKIENTEIKKESQLTPKTIFLSSIGISLKNFLREQENLNNVLKKIQYQQRKEKRNKKNNSEHIELILRQQFEESYQ